MVPSGRRISICSDSSPSLCSTGLCPCSVLRTSAAFLSDQLYSPTLHCRMGVISTSRDYFKWQTKGSIERYVAQYVAHIKISTNISSFFFFTSTKARGPLEPLSPELLCPGPGYALRSPFVLPVCLARMLQ